MKEFKIGLGYDVHRFVNDRRLMLGGVEIPSEKGLEGHSDADVLLHSMCDALLGAGGFEDIGHQFPNTDERFKDIASIELLKSTISLISDEGWNVINTDSVILLETPKIYPFIPQMRKIISDVIGTSSISIKATTSEGLGFIGEKKGCSAYTTVLISR